MWQYFSIVLLLFPLADSTRRNCNGIEYNIINDPRRSTGYDTNNTKAKLLCDRHQLQENVWYRFTSDVGGEMPTTIPKRYRCGTYTPIWMNGSHPTVEDGTVSRTACANVYFGYPLGCGYSYRIKVRNCSGYYIYQLKPPSHCYVAYCAGSKVPNCTNDDPAGPCIANKPPFFTMPDRLYALENSKFQLFINATDPEGYVLSYYYLSNSTVRSGWVHGRRKLASIFVTKTGKVSLEVVDGQNVRIAHTIEVIVVPCPCKNGGKCKSNKTFSTLHEDLSNRTCNCVVPYSGKVCEISPCDDLPCFPGVKCSASADGYECERCPTSFVGDGKHCQLIATDDTVIVEAQFTIDSGLEWKDDLLNKSSLFHKQTTVYNVQQLMQVYNSTKEVLHVVVISYRNGSGVVVQFQVVLKKNIDDPLKPLRTHVESNVNLGMFKVIPQSVKEERKCKSNKTFSTLREDLSNRTCDCVVPYSGKFCEISPCDDLPCFPGVKCSASGDGYECERCPTSFVGDGKHCQLIATDDTVIVEAQFTIESGLEWKDDLLSKSSLFCKQTTAYVVDWLIQVYNGLKEVVHVVVVNYRNGSGVVVEFQVVLKRNIDDPLKSLRTHVEHNGSLGMFKVIPQSVKDERKCKSNKAFSTLREDLSNRPCDCVVPYSGKFCEISPCDDLPCIPGVKCSASADGYECERCPPSFEGDGKHCQLIATDDTVIVEAQFTIDTGLEWRDDLFNKSSLFYKRTTAYIVDWLMRVYSGTKEVLHVVVIGYRKGSVVVEFQVVLKKKMDDPLKPLRTHVEHNGKLGVFKVKPQSLKEENTDEVEGELNVVSGLEWKDELLNKSSSYYKAKAIEITNEINKIYAEDKEFLGAFVTGFRKENLVVEFKLLWRKKVDDPLMKLQRETKLGKLKIDTNSVKRKPTSVPSDKEEKYFGVNKTIFIVVMTFVSVLALTSMIVCGICIRKKRVCVVTLSVSDDRREIFPSNSKRDAHSRVKTPSHNQVMDLPTLRKT